MSNKNIIQMFKWNKLKNSADTMFSIFISGEETKFAHKAWDIIVKSGLANFTNELEEGIVKLRFIALADIYLDYCKVAHEEDNESDYYGWEDNLNIGKLVLEEIYQTILTPEERENIDPDIPNMMQQLSYHYRNDVYDCLVKGYGSDDILFLNLWRSTHKDARKETDSDILNDLTFEKMGVSQWLSGGCDVIRVY